MPITDTVKIGKGTKILHPELVNLYGKVKIGKNCTIGPFVEIQDGVVIGDNTKIESHTFICSGTIIGESVFIGHGVMFINDKYPTVKSPKSNWKKVSICDRVSIGSNATILPVCIHRGAIIGAGTVVTKDVPACELWIGQPARRFK